MCSDAEALHGEQPGCGRVGHFPDYTGINEIIPAGAQRIYYSASGQRSKTRRRRACVLQPDNGIFACNMHRSSHIACVGICGFDRSGRVFALHDQAAAVNAALIGWAR